MPDFDLSRRMALLTNALSTFSIEEDVTVLTPTTSHGLLVFEPVVSLPWLKEEEWNARPLTSFEPQLREYFLGAVTDLTVCARLSTPVGVPDPLYDNKGELQQKGMPGVVFYWKRDRLIVAHVYSV